MNQGKVESIKATFDEAKATVQAVLDCLEDIQNREAALVRSQDIMSQRETELKKRDSKVAYDITQTQKNLDLIAEQMKQVQQAQHDFEIEKDKIDGLRKLIINEKAKVEVRIEALSLLEERKKELDSREADFLKRQEALVQREVLLQKEIIIDRERKEKLAIAEREVLIEKERIKKYLNI